MKIRINLIKGSKNPIRTSEDKEKMDELVQSIAEQGLIVPIKVRPLGDEYEVVYGHRRFHACRELGLAEIECIVEGVDDRNHVVQALTENLVREDMSEPDIARSIKAMKEDYGITNEEVAKMLGWSTAKVEQYAMMMSGEVGKVLETYRGRFPYHYAVEAKAGSKDDKLAAQVVKKAIDEGLNRNQIRKVAEAASIAETPEDHGGNSAKVLDNLQSSPIGELLPTAVGLSGQ